LSHSEIFVSVDDYTEKENFIHGRGYGGVAIFWRKDIDHAIKSHDDGNERINVITVNISMKGRIEVATQQNLILTLKFVYYFF
jgi:hypothetical protein